MVGDDIACRDEPCFYQNGSDQLSERELGELYDEIAAEFLQRQTTYTMVEEALDEHAGIIDINDDQSRWYTLIVDDDIPLDQHYRLIEDAFYDRLNMSTGERVKQYLKEHGWDLGEVGAGIGVAGYGAYAALEGRMDEAMWGLGGAYAMFKGLSDMKETHGPAQLWPKLRHAVTHRELPPPRYTEELVERTLENVHIVDVDTAEITRKQFDQLREEYGDDVLKNAAVDQAQVDRYFGKATTEQPVTIREEDLPNSYNVIKVGWDLMFRHTHEELRDNTLFGGLIRR